MYVNAPTKNLTAHVFKMLARYPAYTDARKKKLRAMVSCLNESRMERRAELAREFSFKRDNESAYQAACGNFDESPIEILTRHFALTRSDARYHLEEIAFRCKNGVL